MSRWTKCSEFGFNSAKNKRNPTMILNVAYRLFPRAKSNGEAFAALTAVVSGVVGSTATLILLAGNAMRVWH
jgi:hypothetical protein